MVSEDLSQRLASMQEQILSRTRLQHLIEQFGLYKTYAEQGTMKALVKRLMHKTDIEPVPMEDLVEQLRKSIKVTPLSPMAGTRSAELPGFNVDVTMREAWLAQQICTEITSMFMAQNLRLHQQHAEETTQFLAKQLEDAKAKLNDQDAKLAAFQSRYMGELPEDEKTNLTLLTGMTPQLEAATQSLNQAQQEKAFAESLLSQQLAAWKSSPDGENPQTLEQQLSNLQKQLSSLKGHYTEKHPDIVSLKKDIAELKLKIAQDASTQDQEQLNKRNEKAPVMESPQIQQLRAQLHQTEVTIRQKRHEQEQLQRQIKVYQDRLQLSPAVQQEFKSLTRDYQTALDFYNELLKKRNESQMATDLERHQQGEQFRVLDPPSLPERPSFPNPPLFGLGGLGVGLAFGVAMAHFLELHDKSLRTRRDVETYLGVPTLAVISSMAPAATRIKNRTGRGAPAKRNEFSLHAASS
ncbi:MAG: lipopolysaccharide biosynthesis protein [Acidobacteria bacterium]|nr:MAG: lipopolysaccharide biosynthesis protein [Acidobacteriota bacterium]